MSTPGTGAEQRRLPRRLGIAGTTLSGVGIILDAGIYVLIGEATADAGSGLWLSFLIASVLAASARLSYAELASMFPEAGASSVYVREGFGRRAGFLVGWLLVAMSVIAAAAVALAFGGYAGDLTGWDPTPPAIAVLLLSGAIVYVGVRETVTIAVAMTLAEAGGLVLVIVIGLPDVGSASLLDAPRGGAGVIAAASLVFFAFTGFEQIATLAEETRNPERTIPRAMLAAIALSTALYLLVAVVSVSVLPWTEIAASAAPLSDAVSRASGDRLGDLLSTIALFATGNTVLLLIATGARLAWGMGRRGLLPPPFAAVAPGRRTPWFATAVVTVMAAGFALGGDIGFVAQLTNFTLFVAFIFVNAAVIRLRRLRPLAPRPPGCRGGRSDCRCQRCWAEHRR